MIYATVNLTIGDYQSTCDKTILLYRGDKNVEIRFVMKGNKFTVLDSTYAQLIIKRPSAVSVFSEPALIQNDTVVLTITEDMVDELKEIGEYTFQIRLYDTDMNARATLPPCNSCLIIERPIATEGEAAVNLAVVNDSAVMPAADMNEEDIFTEDNEYNRTVWIDGDLITDSRLNKIENAIYYINENGGGGGGATAPYISTELDENVQVGTGEDFDLHLDFSSPNLGKGTLKVFINDVDAMSVRIDQGETTTAITGDLLSKGTNKVVVYVLDRVGVMSNSLTFYVRYGGTEVTSDFDPYSAYDYGSPIRYYFTPTALDTSLTLTFHMTIDGVPQAPVSCTSDTRGYYTFPLNLSPDSHYCEAYVMDSKGTKSNVLAFNLIILSTNTIVVASDAKNVTVEEGEQVVLDYKVYMRDNSSFITRTFVDNALVNNGTCGLDFNYYRTSSLPEGVHTVKMEVWDVTETYSDYVIWTVTVTESTYEMLQPTNAGAIFLASAINKSNSDERRNEFIGVDQEGNEISGTLHNFAFNSESGWVDDELIISGNSHVEIPIQPLANNARYGFTLDLEFTSRQIGVEDAEVLTLWNDEKNCGIRITTENLILRSAEGNECNLYFTDNERTNVMFVIDRNERKAKIYLNGVMCEAFHLSDYTADGVAYLEDFTVNSNLILGGYNKNGHSKIRNLRIYQVALTTDEIINNWISCEIDKAKQRELVEFQKGNDLPTMYIYCDFSGLGKDDKKPCKIVYNSTDEAKYGKSFNLDHKQSTCQYQGTSSMAYPIKNYRINLADESGEKWKYDFPGGQPEHRFTLKADFMNSCHAHNTGMAKFINDNLYNYKTNDEKSMNPFKWNHIQNGGDINDFREAINGFPCRLILVNDGETPLNEGQNEPTPGNTKDMGIFNFNNDKDATTTLGFDSDIFPNCASYEVTANSDTSAGAFISYANSHRNLWDGTFVNAYMSSNIFSLPNGNTKAQTAIIEVEPNKTYKIKRTGGNRFRIYCFTAYPEPASKGSTISTSHLSDDNAIEGEIICPDNHYYMAVTVQYNGSDAEEDLNVSVVEVNEDSSLELDYIKQSFELRYPDADDVSEDWGFMGVEDKVLKIDEYLYYGTTQSSNMEASYFNADSITLSFDNASSFSFTPEGTGVSPAYGVASGTTMSLTNVTRFRFSANDKSWTYVDINNVRYYKGTLHDIMISTKNENPYESIRFDDSVGLKGLIDWVDNCTDEEFVRDFEQHFHKDYTLRYYALVVLIGAVDNLGKNMMLDTADNKIFFPRFYDIDTILSYDNSGDIKFDVDIEMEQGYWNTSSSRLWTRLRDLFHDDIVATYNNMRQNGVSYEKIMQYMYDEQISKIPQKYYNMDYDIKYAPFEDSYIGMAHGNGYEHMKRWLKNRFIFCDTLFDYAPSYNNDVLTIRANTTELMNIEIETYTPVYQHVSWYNGQMDKKKIDGKVATGFSGTAMAATDQEVLIYGGSNIKRIKGISSMNPNQMLIGSATKLVDLDASGCPLLADINSNKANLSPHTYLNKVNLKDCPLLGGNLRLNNSPLIQEVDMRGTAITGLNLPSSVRNLQVLRLPNGITDLTLNDAGMLHTLEFDDGVAMNSVSMTNCNALTNVIGLDLLQTPSVTLDSSYNSAAELYFRDTTNLTLRNLPNLERVIFTPNNEYDTFELINVANAPDYKVTTFNCPKLSTFMTTAPYRDSYNNCGMVVKNLVETVTETIDLVLIRGTGFNSDGSLKSGQPTTCYADENFYEVNVGVTCTIEKDGNWTYIVEYNQNKEFVRVVYAGAASENTTYSWTTQNPYVRIGANNGTFIKFTRTYGKVYTIQVKDYGDIQPNTTFTANSIDISNTQFTDVKLLCTTDTNTLKLPTTVKNFYCDSSFDLDTDYLEDGEYDVVHGELVEPYTTDYEGEVVRTTNIRIEYSPQDPRLTPDGTHGDTGLIGASGTLKVSNWGYGGKLFLYDINKVQLAQLALNYIQTIDNYFTYDLTSEYPNTAYFRVVKDYGYNDGFIMIYQEASIPNIIPSSADGSLIFSMYAPSNSVAPASGTWDLYGLEFDNFHTFGMNNDVKPSEDSFMSVIDASNMVVFTGKVLNNNGPMGEVYWDIGQDKSIAITCLKLKAGDHIILTDTDRISSLAYATDIGENASIMYTSGNTAAGEYGKFKLTTDAYIAINFPNTTEYITIDGDYLFIKDLTILSGATLHTSAFFNAMDHASPIVIDEVTINRILGDISSITMPARYDDYNITIKNANISPKTHNTMLYPLLVNEDNPITGTLDYTNYDGKHLSWSFAYTDEEYVNIIQPKYELLNSYEYKYNAFYETEYEFDNPYEVARYTCNASGKFPSFNSGFTYTYDEIDNGDGTYTTRIYADSLDNLPTQCSFYANKEILSVSKINTSQITTMGLMFTLCSNLVEVNTSDWDTSKVTNMQTMFSSCPLITSLDVSNWDTSKVTDMRSMFAGCSNLTSLDVSNWDTGEVTNMTTMFQNCRTLTSLDVSEWDTGKLTAMAGIFQNCSSLTSIDVSGWDTSDVTAISNVFNGCAKLIEIIGTENWDVSNVKEADGCFKGCSSLTSLNLEGWEFHSLNSTYGLAQMFQNCTLLSEIKGIKNLLVSGNPIKRIDNMFNKCESLTTLDLSGWDTGQVTTIQDLFSYCSNLTSIVGINDWNTGNVTNMRGAFYRCDILPSLDLSNWDTSSVKELQGAFQFCYQLEYLNLSGWDTSQVTILNLAFNGNTKLTLLDLSGWTLNAMQLAIASLSSVTPTSTLKGSVIIDESTLPSGWVYDNVLEIAVYTCNASGVLPGFDWQFTNYTSSEVDNGDGTYTTKIVTDSLDNLPTQIHFQNNRNLLSVAKINTSGLTTMAVMFNNCSSLTEINGLKNWDTSKITAMNYLFGGCKLLTSLDLSKWDVSNVTTMLGMFQNCNILTSLDVSGWDTSNVTNMSYMFNGCIGLESLDVSGWDTSKVINMVDMFRDTGLITLDLTNWNPGSKSNESQTVNMSNLCRASKSLTTVIAPNLVNEKVEAITYIFDGCNKLSSINMTNWDTVNVVDMIGAFTNTAITDVSFIKTWDLSSVKYMGGIFQGTPIIRADIPNLNAPNLERINGLFHLCRQITYIDISGWTTGAITHLNGFSYLSDKLTYCNMSGLDISTITDGANLGSIMEYSGVSDFYPPNNISVSISFGRTTDLTVDSLIRILNNLATVTTTQTLTLGTTNLAKLTEEQIAIATNKGWTVA